MDIKPIGPLTPTGMTSAMKAPKGSAADITDQFSDFLAGAIQGQGERQQNVRELTRQFAAGELADPHTLLIAAEKSSVGLAMTIQFRNKAIEAYQEIMRTQM